MQDFQLKNIRKRLAAGLRPDPLGELKRSPRPPSREKGGRDRGREGKGLGKGERGKGRGSGRARVGERGEGKG